VFLSSCLSGEAQTLATQVFPPQARPEPTMAMFRAPPTHPLPTVFRSVQLSTKPVAHLSFLLITAHSPDRSLDSLSPVESNATLFGSQALLPVVQFWSGRLQLGASESTLHMENVIMRQGHLVSSPFGRLLWRQPGVPLWAGSADRRPDPSMATYDAVCWCRSVLNLIASCRSSTSNSV
jgi:hypothetical protein